MKLYYSPGACSMAPHIVAREAGHKIDLEKVDIPAKKTVGGEDFWTINSKGYVPALKMDNGQVLTEVGVIIQYLADQKPESGLTAKMGTMERYRQMEAVNFAATEIHKQLGAFFNPKMTPEMKEVQLGTVERRFNALENCSPANSTSQATNTLWRMRTCSRCSTGPKASRSTWTSGRTSRISWPVSPPGRQSKKR